MTDRDRYSEVVTVLYRVLWINLAVAVAKIALGIIVVMFTLGVSDLGDMID